MSRRNPSWSDEENRVTVEAYLKMLVAQFEGRHFVKAEINRQVHETIGRVPKAVEYKFRNISAVLRDLRHPVVAGYKPLPNYQGSLRDAALDALGKNPRIMNLAFEFVTKEVQELEVPPQLEWRVVDPPNVPEIEVDESVRRAMKVDFVQVEANNRKLGFAGETAIAQREREYLRRHGQLDLADRVTHVSLEEGDGLGFDVLSFELDGREKLIEVKTTRQSEYWPIIASRNEVKASQAYGDAYHLYRVFNFGAPGLGLYQVRGDLEIGFRLNPISYSGTPRGIVTEV